MNCGMGEDSNYRNMNQPVKDYRFFAEDKKFYRILNYKESETGFRACTCDLFPESDLSNGSYKPNPVKCVLLCSPFSSRASNIMQNSKGKGKVTERTTKKKDVQECAKTSTSCGEVLLTVQCKHNAEEVSLVCPCPRNPLLQTLTRENRATHQNCSAAVRWEEDSVSQPTYALRFQESIQLGPLCRT